MQGDKPREVEGIRVAFYTRVYDILRNHLERLEIDLEGLEKRRQSLQNDMEATKKAMDMLTSPEGLGDKEALQTLASSIPNTLEKIRKRREKQREEKRE